ncbi:MAG: hypothetical protein RSB61_04840 [Clostridia bacterium]
MKKKIALILLLSIALIFVFAGCKSPETTEKFTFVAPDGAPALAVNSMLGEKTFANVNVKTSIVPTSQISSQAVQSDIAILPSNLAVKLANSGKDIKILSIITSGNLYILSSLQPETDDIAQLKGKKIISIGRGGAPDLIFQKILKDNKIDSQESETEIDGKVALSYSSDPSGIIPLLAKAKKDGKMMYGILAEPAVATALSKGLFQAFDLQELWQKNNQNEQKGFAQAVLVASGKVCLNKALVSALLSNIENSVEIALTATPTAVSNVKSNFEQTVLNEKMTQSVVERCNLQLKNIAGNEKNMAFFEDTIRACFELSPNSVGGAMPKQEFYYIG